jgi:hypothetical protein
VVEAIGGFEEEFVGSLQLYEDQAFLSKLYLARPVYFSDALWLDYRQHPDSCVATVVRDGRYDEVRSYFLTWLEGHLDQLPDEPSPAVRKAVARELRRYRRPLADAVLTSAERLAVGGRGVLGRVKRVGKASAAPNTPGPR